MSIAPAPGPAGGRRPLICARVGADDAVTTAVLEAAIATGADLLAIDVRFDAAGRLVLASEAATGDPAAVSMLDLLELCRGRIGLDLVLAEPTLSPRLGPTLDGWTDPLLITGFAPAVLADIRHERPDVRTGLLIEAPVTEHPIQAARRCGANVVLWADELVTPTVLRSCTAAGLAVWAWTTNAPFRLAERLAEPGLEGIITDDPGLAVTLAGPREAESAA